MKPRPARPCERSEASAPARLSFGLQLLRYTRKDRRGAVGLFLLFLTVTLPGQAQQTTTSQPSPPAVPGPTRPTLPAPSANPDTAALRRHLRQAAALQAQYKESAALAEYQAVLKAKPQHYESLWRATALCVRIGNRYTDDTRKAAYFKEAHDYAERAVALQPEGGESNYALALALFSQAGLLGARDRLRLFQQLEKPVEKAVTGCPNLPEAWQLLGRWHYRVAHYNVLEKAYSHVVLGGRPVGAHVSTAIAALEKARALAPERVQFSYDLARVYKYENQRPRAIALLTAAVRLPTYTSEDLTVNRLCQQLLAPLARRAARHKR